MTLAKTGARPLDQCPDFGHGMPFIGQYPPPRPWPLEAA
jgi:hypothetical protein